MQQLHIRCDCCEMNQAVWVVFGSVRICDRCRLKTVDRMREWGFSLAYAHPFTDEFTGITRKPYVVPPF